MSDHSQRVETEAEKRKFRLKLIKSRFSSGVSEHTDRTKERFVETLLMYLISLYKSNPLKHLTITAVVLKLRKNNKKIKFGIEVMKEWI